MIPEVRADVMKRPSRVSRKRCLVKDFAATHPAAALLTSMTR
jgi:hypothetical protein